MNALEQQKPECFGDPANRTQGWCSECEYYITCRSASNAIEWKQPSPKPNNHQATWALVISDMVNRNNIGVAKYGTPLQPFNGRNSLQDAYEEVLDLAVYLKNAIVESEKK